MNDKPNRGRAVLLLAASLCALCVIAGEPLVRSDFAFDGVSGLLGWQGLEIEGGAASVDRIEEKGPGGVPVVRISGSAKSCVFSSEKMNLVPGEPYRLSARVRASGFRAAAGKMKVRGVHMAGPAEVGLPGDTQGTWRLVELKIPALPEARRSEYRLSFELENPKEGDRFDICDPRLEPQSEKAKKRSAPIGSFAPMVARVVPVEPLMSNVDATTGYMRFRANTDTNGCEIVATVDGKPLGPMAEGRHEVTVKLVEKATGKVRAENVYPFLAKIPKPVPEVGRRLNNFVTEVVNAPLKDGTYAFTNPRRGWVFIGFDKPYPGAEAYLSGLADPVVVFRPGEPSETLRHLEPGDYRLTVKGSSGGRLRIHLVKPLVMNGMGIFQSGSEFRDTWDKCFRWDFYRKVALPVTAEFDGRFYSVPGYDVGSEKYREFLDRMGKRGKRVFGIGSLAASALATRCDLAKVRQRFCDNVYFKDGLPVSIDENGFHDSMRSLNLVGEASWEMANLLDPRPLYVCWFCMQSFPLADWRPVLAPVSATVNTGLGTGYLVSESYLSAKADPKSLEGQIQNLIANQRILSEMMPEAGKRIIHLLSGWNQIGCWTNHHVPQVDEKVMMEEFVNRLANDPAFADVGGLGFSTPACGEELMRWVCRLMHHYAVEGRTDSISEANGWRRYPGTVADGDFLKGLAKWTVSAAEQGSVAAESRRGFARHVQQRNSAAHEEGDFFAILTRSAKGPNRLSQTLRNLTPGRLYALEFATSDYADVLKPGSVDDPDLDLRAEVEGSSFEDFYTTRIFYGNPAKKGKKATATRVMGTRLVFRAPAAEAKLTFSDWESEMQPGGAFGRRLTLNYISVNPYFEPAPGELE